MTALNTLGIFSAASALIPANAPKPEPGSPRQYPVSGWIRPL